MLTRDGGVDALTAHLAARRRARLGELEARDAGYRALVRTILGQPTSACGPTTALRTRRAAPGERHGPRRQAA
jgi:hypothetical protein